MPPLYLSVVFFPSSLPQDSDKRALNKSFSGHCVTVPNYITCMDKRGVRVLGGFHFGGSFVEGNDGGGGFSCLNLELHIPFVVTLFDEEELKVAWESGVFAGWILREI
ncbi:hypothetical protein D5086_021806 [Populus alba]|uniref:Uncharacterized protein n=1 Tax=Populus alba TaxID=43335 RepID=A0ACC4BD92_POPAL